MSLKQGALTRYIRETKEIYRPYCNPQRNEWFPSAMLYYDQNPTIGRKLAYADASDPLQGVVGYLTLETTPIVFTIPK